MYWVPESGIGETNREAARIARVERGLLPSVAILNRTRTAYALSDRMQHYAVPGVSIAVIDSGRIVWARGYGLAEAGHAQPVDSTTLFQAGSISKAITAVAALHLIEQGKLDLDEDVNRRLVAWKVPPSGLMREEPVTLRRLLSHSAGINVASFPGYQAGTPVPTLLQVLEGESPANTPPVRVESEPGTQWNYSGGGMSIVQQLIVDATGRSFADILQAAVFGPASMTRTVAEQPLSVARAGGAATGHSGGIAVAGRWHVYPELAAAGLWSTAPDLARFGVALLHATRGDTRALLKPATASEMVERQIDDWGLGFSLGGGAGDSATVGHEGSTVGYCARLLVLPATRQGIAVMTNGESEALIDEITRAVAHEYAWPVRARIEKTVADVDREGYVALAGRYRIEVGSRVIDLVISTDGSGAERRLLITGQSKRAVELLPLSPLHFFSQDSGSEFTFAGEGDAITHLRIDQQGQSFEARRVP
jgi:CubicO group peptidase (beta-lactamase class C family)